MSAGGCQCLLKNACNVTCHMACPYSVPVSMCGTFSAVKLCAGWRVHVMRVLCYARAYMSSLFRWIVLSLQGQGVGCAPRCDFQCRPQVCKARYGEDEVLCETFRLGFVWRDMSGRSCCRGVARGRQVAVGSRHRVWMADSAACSLEGRESLQHFARGLFRLWCQSRCPCC
jgi:hypothetical protein